MITSTTSAFSLGDLTDDYDRIVATREPMGRVWFYTLPDREIKQFREQVGHGDIVSVQRREPDGSWVVLARLKRAR